LKVFNASFEQLFIYNSSWKNLVSPENQLTNFLWYHHFILAEKPEKTLPELGDNVSPTGQLRRGVQSNFEFHTISAQSEWRLRRADASCQGMRTSCKQSPCTSLKVARLRGKLLEDMWCLSFRVPPFAVHCARLKRNLESVGVAPAWL
jgi:hypothetical protein